MKKKGVRWSNHFHKTRAIITILRGGSVMVNMNQSRESWVNSTRRPVFISHCTIEGRPITGRDVRQ